MRRRLEEAPLLITATIAPSSPRYELWMRVYGTDTLPLLSAHSARGTFPGKDGPQECYRVDVGQLTRDQRQALAEHIARAFSISIEQVLADLADPDHGLPVLAQDVSVKIDGRPFH